jgi:hypothetical protein
MKLKAEIVEIYERLEQLGPEQLGVQPLQWLRTLRIILGRANG